MYILCPSEFVPAAATRTNTSLSRGVSRGSSSMTITLGGGLAVEEHHVLRDGLTADVQLIGGEVWVGVADR